MELKEMAAKIREVLGVSDMAKLSERLMQILESSDCEMVFDSYVAVVDDLKTDYLQKSYQFWLADRGSGSKQQDFTPASLAKLTAVLMQAQDGDTIYDVCAGSGALTIAAWNNNKNLRFVCHEFDAGVIPVLLFNLAIRGIEAVVLRGDVLKNEIVQAWKIVPNGKYGAVCALENYVLGVYDACISNPPYNIPWNPPADDGLFGGDNRFVGCPVPCKENANYAFVYHALAHLKEGGCAAFILPCGVMNDTKELEIRQHFIKNGLLKAVIKNPPNMFESTNIPTCILLCEKRGAVGDVVLIDGSGTTHQEIREQRGEGSAGHANRIYKKTLNVYSDDDLTKIATMVDEPKNLSRLSQVVDVAQFAEQDYIFSPSRYMPVEEEKIEHRFFKDIVDDIRKIQREKNAVKITMNETLARKMGYDELLELLKKSAETTKNINEGAIRLLGLEPLEGESYFTTSKRAGEIKIENTSKESMSSLFRFFLPMWKQHIYYLNECENELLTEFRDALLPELMSGQLDVSSI